MTTPLLTLRKHIFPSLHLALSQSRPSGHRLLRSMGTTSSSGGGGSPKDTEEAKSSPPSKDNTEEEEEANKPSGDTTDQKKKNRSQAALKLLQELLREPAPEPQWNTDGTGPAVVTKTYHHDKAMRNSSEQVETIPGVINTPRTQEEKSNWLWKDQLTTMGDDRTDVEMDETGSFSFSSSSNALLDGADEVYDDYENDYKDPFNKFEAGDVCLPEDLNWYNKENDEERQKTRYVAKPAKLFQHANQDPLELALNPDLLRQFLSPTGRIQPRRFTGLSAKAQRRMKRAVKLSRNLALLPFLSQYPRPSAEQRNELLDFRGSDDFQLYSQGLGVSREAQEGEEGEKHHGRNRGHSSSFDARGYEMQQIEPSQEDIYKIDVDLDGLDEEFKKRR